MKGGEANLLILYFSIYHVISKYACCYCFAFMCHKVMKLILYFEICLSFIGKK